VLLGDRYLEIKRLLASISDAVSDERDMLRVQNEPPLIASPAAGLVDERVDRLPGSNVLPDLLGCPTWWIPGRGSGINVGHPVRLGLHTDKHFHCRLLASAEPVEARVSIGRLGTHTALSTIQLVFKPNPSRGLSSARALTFKVGT
jgi:hypothetical protein